MKRALAALVALGALAALAACEPIKPPPPQPPPSQGAVIMYGDSLLGESRAYVQSTTQLRGLGGSALCDSLEDIVTTALTASRRVDTSLADVFPQK